jgi:ketosteroid isomerase-like protein
MAGAPDERGLRAQEEAFARAFAARDLHGLGGYYRDDVVYLSPTVRLYDWPARIQGFARMVEFVHLTLASCSEIEYRPIELALLPDGRSAFARIHFDWDADGKLRLRSSYVVLYRYREGRIAQQELYYDPSGRVERLGSARRPKRARQEARGRANGA